IAKLITHGESRGEAIARMRDALNSFIIRGVSSNIAFQSALTQHPRFISGEFSTGFLAEEFPGGFHPSNLAHEEPFLLGAAAAYARRRYIDRAVRITGQLKGHGRQVGLDWVVLMQGKKYPLSLTLVPGGADIVHEGQSYALRTDWRLGEILLRGTWDGEPV